MQERELSPPFAAVGWVLVTFALLLSATWWRHTDVGDAQVYQVVARHILEDGDWLSLRYLPSAHARFYEHLPFGFWLLAAPMWALGEWSLRPLFALMSAALVVLTGVAARRLAGAWAGLAAMLVLATTEKFFFQAGYPLLDPPLLLLATGAAGVVLVRRPSASGWALAGLLAAGATAVKGPFGLVPFAAVVAARAIVDRSPRILAGGAAVAILAVLPVGVFLLLRPDWREGYLAHQLVDSLTGARADGSLERLYAVKTIAGRFWPWLPLVVPGVLLALGWPRAAARWLAIGSPSRPARLLALAILFAVLALSIPARKIWHHTLVAYPLLAMLCGVAVGPRLSALLSTRRRVRRVVWGLAGLAAISAAAVPLGLEKLLMNPPCAIATEFSEHLNQIPPGTDVLVVSERVDWDTLSALALEHRLFGWPAEALEPAPSDERAGRAPIALVRESLWSGHRQSWIPLAEGRGWVLAQRMDSGIAGASR